MGYNQNHPQSEYDQNTEDVTLYLSHKTAKDLILIQDKQVFTGDELREVINMETLPFANSLLWHMQEYILTKIEEHKLPFDSIYGLKDHDALRRAGLSGGLEPMAYFLFKAAYEDDSRYGQEWL